MGDQTAIIKNSSIQGSKTSYLDVRHPKYFISIRFAPKGYYKFLDESQKLFTDHVFNLEEVMDNQSGYILPALQQRSSAIQRFQVMIEWLKNDLSKQKGSSKLISDFIIGQINRNPRIFVKQLVEETGYTRKHLGQRFKEETGLTIKQFQQIDRIHRLLNHINAQINHRGHSLSASSAFTIRVISSGILKSTPDIHPRTI